MDDKRYWNVMEPVCRELDRRGLDVAYLTASPDDPALQNPYAHVHAEFLFPLLMVKDFNAKGFSFSDTFMTTADVPTLATSGLIDNPTNPFTGNAINANAKYDRPFYAFMSYDWDTSKNNGNQFFPGDWYRIDNQNARDKRNWVPCGTETVLPDAPR